MTTKHLFHNFFADLEALQTQTTNPTPILETDEAVNGIAIIKWTNPYAITTKFSQEDYTSANFKLEYRRVNDKNQTWNSLIFPFFRFFEDFKSFDESHKVYVRVPTDISDYKIECKLSIKYMDHNKDKKLRKNYQWMNSSKIFYINVPSSLKLKNLLPIGEFVAIEGSLTPHGHIRGYKINKN